MKTYFISMIMRLMERTNVAIKKKTNDENALTLRVGIIGSTNFGDVALMNIPVVLLLYLHLF